MSGSALAIRCGGDVWPAAECCYGVCFVCFNCSALALSTHPAQHRTVFVGPLLSWIFMKYVENNYSRMQSGWYVMVCWSYLTHGGAQERFTRVPVITDVRDPYFVCHGRSIDNTRAHNSEKRYDRPHGLMHFYHLYTYTIDIQPENRVLAV